ncbi:hypothetical protein B0H16DRAFT_1488083 [Mycena metata]|uniref:Uncharacterized protein n=1 Tax=Mycena metata TaxID=1033252 RepID=A0AAD7P336_9AGAR|nr:hypothetical protein B0H16DRAFT_1488083 [Mycena metata]
MSSRVFLQELGTTEDEIHRRIDVTTDPAYSTIVSTAHAVLSHLSTSPKALEGMHLLSASVWALDDAARTAFTDFHGPGTTPAYSKVVEALTNPPPDIVIVEIPDEKGQIRWGKVNSRTDDTHRRHELYLNRELCDAVRMNCPTSLLSPGVSLRELAVYHSALLHITISHELMNVVLKCIFPTAVESQWCFEDWYFRFRLAAVVPKSALSIAHLVAETPTATYALDEPALLKLIDSFNGSEAFKLDTINAPIFNIPDNMLCFSVAPEPPIHESPGVSPAVKEAGDCFCTRPPVCYSRFSICSLY